MALSKTKIISVLWLSLHFVPAYAAEPLNQDATVSQSDPATQTETKAIDANVPGAKTVESDEVALEDLPPIPEASQKDPLEGLNRAMFTFNDKLDSFLLKPIATVYNKVMPKPLNKGVHNVFNNINTMTTIANDILQANFHQAANDTWRFGINSTVGILGIFDIAERMNLEPYTNDFGLTMAKWGYKNSTYLVLPFFGPNTIRDGLSIPVDYFAFSVYPYIQPESTRYEIYGVGVIDRRAQLLKVQDVVDEASLDKYVFMRNAYMQRRQYQIEQNQHRGACDRQQHENVELATEENYD